MKSKQRRRRVVEELAARQKPNGGNPKEFITARLGRGGDEIIGRFIDIPRVMRHTNAFQGRQKTMGC